MWKRTPTGQTCRGFTLVELLVVISIISILVAMLLPALSKARQHANTLTCAANFRQIGIMFSMYANDNRGYLPPVNWKHNLDNSIPNHSSYGMVHALGPYMGRPRWAGTSLTIPYIYAFNDGDRASFRRSVFVCPEYQPTGYDIQPYLSGVAESGYLIHLSPAPRDQTLPRKLTKARRPASSLIHVADSFQDYSLKDRAQLWAGGRSFDIYRHNNRKAANVLFLDGHVNTYQASYIKKNVTSRLTLD
ncbi:MAG TPA: prepilin-type N-terminal cleavage/methylation domain-containing protein [Tepidisphaeraceae bacterium]|jgi:prepilin-type N-terminal cleavage/methylation domain-containing protein/prepilin-type processing-associated H-X9-DG protein|nr:prepilin-type N-terminal cleavage/methylation domain-containing protein [Tepidisphaeraceae bacterium]